MDLFNCTFFFICISTYSYFSLYICVTKYLFIYKAVLYFPNFHLFTFLCLTILFILYIGISVVFIISLVFIYLFNRLRSYFVSFTLSKLTYFIEYIISGLLVCIVFISVFILVVEQFLVLFVVFICLFLLIYLRIFYHIFFLVFSSFFSFFIFFCFSLFSFFQFYFFQFLVVLFSSCFSLCSYLFRSVHLFIIFSPPLSFEKFNILPAGVGNPLSRLVWSPSQHSLPRLRQPLPGRP